MAIGLPGSSMPWVRRGSALGRALSHVDAYFGGAAQWGDPGA